MNRKLPDLPPSDQDSLKKDQVDGFYQKKPSEVWVGEVNNREPETVTDGASCNHFFKMRNAREVECTKCKAGVFIGAGDEIAEGHIYNQGKFIA